MTEEYNLSACTMSIEHADFLTAQVKIFMHTLMLSKGFQSVILEASMNSFLLDIEYLKNPSQLAWEGLLAILRHDVYISSAISYFPTLSLVSL